ncbi:MAG: orotate phosphoribosyltransferase [Bacillota bacterium]
MEDLARLRERLLAACLLEGDFTLRSGKKSRYYLDKYRFVLDPTLLAPLAEAIAARLPAETEVLAAPELGAVPLLTAVSLRTGLPGVIVRKAEKEYGTKKKIEGHLPSGAGVALLEDVVTTGGQAIASAEVLRSLGARILAVIAVVDRGRETEEAMAAAGLPYMPLFRVELD